jgi:hypothetical protein
VVSLPPELAALARSLTGRFEDVVPDADLIALVAEVGHGPVAPRDVRQHMTNLRAMMRPLDLAVRRIKRRGYMLQRR